MARQVIYVLSHGTKWKVQCDHCKDEPIKDTQADAIKVAKKHVAGLPAGTQLFQRFAFRAKMVSGLLNGRTVKIPFRRLAKYEAAASRQNNLIHFTALASRLRPARFLFLRSPTPCDTGEC
jgi:hypothetical protein